SPPDYATSNRSAFITFVHAATKSRVNLACASLLAYTSASERSCEFEPNTRSARVPVHLTLPVLRSRPSSTPVADDFFHTVFMSSRLTKKSFVNVCGRLVKPPSCDPS